MSPRRKATNPAGPNLAACRKGGLEAGRRKRAQILARLDGMTPREAWKSGYYFGYRAGRGQGRQGKVVDLEDVGAVR